MQGNHLRMPTKFYSLIKKVLVICILIQLTACATNFRQGLNYLENHNYPEALSYFEKDAQLGYRIPAIHAANLYIIDYQVPRNLEKSRYYLDLALKADYGRYDQVYDYYIPLVRAYQILADTEQPNKQEAFYILNYVKYQEYTWPLYVLGHCHLVGYGTEININLAKKYFERAFENQITDHNNAYYAWWLAVYPDPTFRNPERALSLVLSLIDDDDVYDQAIYLDTLAAVYASNEKFGKAIETQEKAIAELNKDIQKYEYMSAYKTAFDARLEYYKQHKPWIYSVEDIKRCGYDSKRCLKTLFPSLSIEGDLSTNILMQ
jgi:TPR repeat protein